MKRFKFTLQSLLGVKIALEKQRKAELNIVNQRLRALREELEAIETRRRLRRDEFMSAESLSTLDLNIYAVGFRALAESIEAQEGKILVCEQERARAQQQVLEVMRERKTLEKLREKQYEAYRAEARKEDELAIGEFVANKIAVGDDTGGVTSGG